MSLSNFGLAAAWIVVSLIFFPWMFSQEVRWDIVYILAAISILFIKRIPKPALIAGLFILWSALSLAWSPDPSEGAIGLSSMVALWLCYVASSQLSSATMPHAAGIALFGALILVWLFPYQIGGFGNENWITEWMVLMLPLIDVRWRGLTWWFGYWLVNVALIGTTIVYLVFYNDSYTEAAVAFGLIIIWCIWKRKWWFLPIPFLAMAAAGYLNPDILDSLKSRLEIWTDSIFLWLNSPLWGHGLGSFNYLYPLFQEKHLLLFPHLGTRLHPVLVFVGAAHNELLQALAETGLVGATIFGWFLWAVWRRLKVPQQTPPAVIGSLLIGAILCMFAFPLQNPATAFPLAVLLGLASRGSGYALPGFSWRWFGRCFSVIGSFRKRVLS